MFFHETMENYPASGRSPVIIEVPSFLDDGADGADNYSHMPEIDVSKITLP